MSSTCVRIIAEAGVNHNGSRDMALELVDAAAAAGADVVKFQSFNAAKLASAAAPKAAYQRRNTSEGETQLAMLERLQLSAEDHEAIIERCKERGIGFLSTPFDFESLALLTNRFNLPEIKLGSGELNNAPLLLEVGRTGVRVVLSTGMGTLAEVEDALGVLAYAMTHPDAPASGAEFREALTQQAAWPLLKSLHAI